MLTIIRKRTRKKTVRARSWLKFRKPLSKAVSSGFAARRATISPKAVRAPVCDDLGGCRSANDRCAQKDHVARIRFGRGGLRGRFFFGGHRFARERGLQDIEITRNQETRSPREPDLRPRAGRCLPAPRHAAGISFHSPSRSTVAVGATCSRSCSMARWER